MCNLDLMNVKSLFGEENFVARESQYFKLETAVDAPILKWFVSIIVALTFEFKFDVIKFFCIKPSFNFLYCYQKHTFI